MSAAPGAATLNPSRNRREAAERRADEIDRLPYVVESVRLPDFHIKEGMEAPASFVVACRDMIVSQLVSESINDGMGMIRTGIPASEARPDQLVDVLMHLNRSGARTKLTPSPYSWTPGLVELACRSGAAPLVTHYGLDPALLDRVEDQGRAAGKPIGPGRYRALVPAPLRRSRVVRSEVGLNFGGNHFLELQAVDRIVDRDRAAELGLMDDELVVMYHLGPGPMGGILSNLYSYRQKPTRRRKIGYGALRSLLQLSKGPNHLRTFGSLRRWNPVEAGSEAGRTLADVLAIVKNYGFAYRMGTIRAITDAVEEAFGQDRAAIQLVTDTSHNILQPERIGGEELWVSRANCCRAVPGAPGIVAGSNQIGSCITVGAPGSDDRIGGFDHGIGFLLEQAKAAGELRPDPRHETVQHLKMIRGTETIDTVKSLPLLQSSLMEQTLETLSSKGFVEPVAFLRPLANLKHKVPR